MTQTLSLPDIEALAFDCLTRAGAPASVATHVSAEVAAAEAAGERAFGLEGLLRDIRAIRYGQLLPQAQARLRSPRPGLMLLDAGHGFAIAALNGALDDLRQAALTQGVAILRLDHASPAGAMITAIRHLARNGCVAIGIGQDAIGRVGHPDDPDRLIKPAHAGPYLQIAGPFGWQGDVQDDPTAGPDDRSAWLVATDPLVFGPSEVIPAEAALAPMPAARSVALPPELLAQLIAA